MHFEGFIVKIGNGWGPAKKYVNEGIMKPIEFSYNDRKNQQELKETNDNEILLLENKVEETTELSVVEIEEENPVNNQGKGLTFRWTLSGIEAIKEVLLSENYIVKNGNVYSENNETLKEFKKKYREWKEKK